MKRFPCPALVTMLVALVSLPFAAKAAYDIRFDLQHIGDQDVEWLPGVTRSLASGQTFEMTIPVPTGRNFDEWRIYANYAEDEPVKWLADSGDAVNVSHAYDSKLEMTVGGKPGTVHLIPYFTYWTYSVAYDPNGGTWTGAEPAAGPWEYPNGKKTPSKSAISREGYTLSGWVSDTDVTLAPGTAFTGEKLGVAEDEQEVVLTATWAANEYTATIDAGDGGVGGSSVNYAYSEQPQTLTIELPTYEEHEIASWTASGYKGSAPTIKDNALTIPAKTSGNFTMTANWSANRYAISTAVTPAGSGTVAGGGTFDYGTKITLTATPGTGYAFVQWQDGSTDASRTVAVTASMTYTATFEKLSYAVACKPGQFGTGEEQSQTKKYGETLTLPGAIFTRAGHNQDGWSYDDGGEKAFALNGSYFKNESATLYPHWAAIMCTLGLSNDGNGTASAFPSGTSHKYGAEITLTAVPKAGYAFWKWMSTVEPKAVYENPHVFAITNDIQFKACFTNRLCVVTFDAQGGTCAETTRSVVYGSALGPLPPTTNDPFGFLGWYDDPTAGTLYTQTSKITSDLTLYAHWTDEPVQYDVAVKVDPEDAGTPKGGGTYDLGSTAKVCVEPAKGYEFAHWQDGSNDAVRVVEVRNDMSFVATMVPATYTLNFDPTEGTLPEGQEVKTITYGEPYGDLPEPDPASGARRFTGWFTAQSGGTQVETNTVVASTEDPQFLYAQWRDFFYAITYVTDGGKINGEYPKDYKPGVAATLPTDVTKDGCDFGGWYLDSDCAGVRQYGIAAGDSGDKTYYAKWTAHECAVIYRPNTGLDAATVTDYYALGTKDVHLERALFFRDGYTQVGWDANPSGTTRSNALGDNIGTITNDVVRYPYWKANAYAIAFDGNGGTGEMDSQAANYGQPVTLSKCEFTREGFEFAGWALGEDGHAVFADGTAVSNLTMKAGDTVTLYAAWEATTPPEPEVTHYTIHFSPGADVLNPTAMPDMANCAVGVATNLPACVYTNLASKGFLGWVWNGQTNKFESAGSFDPAIVFENQVITLYAAWDDGGAFSKAVGLSNAVLVATDNFGWTPPTTWGVNSNSNTIEYSLSAIGSGGHVAQLYMNVVGPGIVKFKAKMSQGGWDLPMDLGNIATTARVTNVESEYAFTLSQDGEIKVQWNAPYASLARTITLKDITWTPLHTNCYDIVTTAEDGGMASGGGTVNAGETVSLNAVPDEGCQFVQWSDGDTNAARTATIWGDMTNYVAQFKSAAPIAVDSFYANFSGNGATSGAMGEQKIAVGVATKLAANGFARTGHTFSHWLAPDGKTYADGAEVADLAEKGRGVLLTAVWAANEYEVVFDKNAAEATGMMEPLVCRYGWTMQLPSVGYSREFSVFDGWTNSAGRAFADRAVFSNLTAKAGEAIPLYAKWTDLGADLSSAVGLTNAVLRVGRGDVGAWESLGDRQGAGFSHEGFGNGISTMYMRVAGPGVLTFDWHAEGVQAQRNAWIAIGSETNGLSNTGAGIVGQRLEVKSAGTVVWGAEYQSASGDMYLVVNDVCWTPSAPAGPVPAEKDRRDISEITVLDGAVSLTVTNADERFDYQLHGTNALITPLSLWPVMWTTNGTGTIVIEPPKTGDPQMFYYLQTVQRQQ